MSNIPSELKYVITHEWARLDQDGLITVGITDHAQELLGDIVFLELPEIDSELSAGDEAGVVESVKAASDIYMPVSGTIVEINAELEKTPSSVNNDPYGEGWLFRIQPNDVEDLSELLDAEDYHAQLSAEDH